MSYAWDGFRMIATTLDEAMDAVEAFRPIALAMLHDWNARLLADTAVQLIDQAHVRGKNPPSAPLSQAWEEIQDRRTQIVRSEQRDPLVDPEFRLTLLRHERRIHGLVHTERREWHDQWMAQPGVDDFSWWNGSDRPDGITEQEWDHRAGAWKAMIPDMWPAGHGSIVILTPRYFSSTPEEVLSAIPDMTSRRRRTAADLAVSARIKEVVGTASYAENPFAAAARATSWVTTDEGIAERDRLMAELVLPDIDLPTLLGFDPEKNMPERQKDRQ